MRDKIFNDDTLAQIVQVQAIEISQLQSQLSLSAEREERYRKVLEDVIGEIDVPDAICSCHVSPPCNDCVEYSHLRDLVNIARTTLNEGKEVK